ALIGDPDRDDLARVDVLGDFVNRLDDRAPDVVQVMFDPTWLRKMLIKIGLSLSNSVEVRIHQERRSAGRSLVDGENIVHRSFSIPSDEVLTEMRAALSLLREIAKSPIRR